MYAAAVAPDLLMVSERTGRVGWDTAQELAYRPAEIGEAFGPQWATYWFRVLATVPDEWAGRRVDLLWDSGSEATLWRDGLPLLRVMDVSSGAVRDESAGVAVGSIRLSSHDDELEPVDMARFDADKVA